MQRRQKRQTRDRSTNWRRTGIKATILLVLLCGTLFGITQAIILLAIYAIVVMPL